MASLQVRDRSRSSQRPSFDLTASRSAQASSPGAGTKRLFSNRQMRMSVEPELEEKYTNDHNIYSGKRNRSDNWPLPESSPAVASVSRKPLQNRDVPNSPNLERPRPVKRPSKFVEGSMNDRASQKPEVAYLGFEQESLMENYAWEQASKPRPQSCVPTSSNSNTALPDINRHSSIFRFGKSIAATFNPSNWKMFSKQDRGVQEIEVEDPQQKILRERQEKAERIYAELKQTGHFPTIRAQNLEVLLDRTAHVKHDSGVSFIEHRDTSIGRTSMDSQRSMSKEDKRKGMIFLDPPSLPTSQPRGMSPSTSNFLTPSRNSFQNLKRNSMSNIKKRFKLEQPNHSTTDLNGLEDSAHKLPSRKDMQKQQKLVKRVSDLESKLEQARRKLNESLENSLPPPEHRGRVDRRKFVPGAMPTLHSERLLAAFVHSEGEEEEDDGEIGRAMTEDVVVEPRQSLEETRGRSRVVREPEVSPSRFYPESSPLTREALLSQQTPYENKQLAKLKNEKFDDFSDTSVTSVASGAHSVYVDKVAPSEDELELLSAAESTSVISPSEPNTDDEMITPKARGRNSATTTPKKLTKNDPTPKKVSPSYDYTTPVKTTPAARKRKVLADNSGVYKPSGTSTSGDSDVRPMKKLTPKRKAVATTATKSSIPTPPRRLPPIHPAAAANIGASTGDSVTQQHVSKVVKTGAASPPSSLAKQGSVTTSRTSPIRTISRKAVPSSTSRLHKTAPGERPNALQSTPPPPSASTFELKLDSDKSASECPQPEVEVAATEDVNEADRNATQEPNGDLTNRRIRDRSVDIPPMPELPTTVRLPSGEVVNVKSKAPMVAPRASSRAGSRTRSAISSASASKPGVKDSKVVKSVGGSSNGSHKKAVAKSDTRGSFEWPADCF